MVTIIAANADILADLHAIAVINYRDTKLLHGSMARQVVGDNRQARYQFVRRN